MKKITLLLVLFIAFSSCEISQESDLIFLDEGEITEYFPCDFQGRNYIVTSYLYEIPVDFNNDNTYSNNIINETSCYVSSMDFDENDRAYNMLSQFPSARVTTDGNGNLIQNSGCINSDGARLTCYKNGEEVILTFNDNTIYTGTLSDNGDVITFVVPNETLIQYHSGIHEILNENGSVTNYAGAITIRFELQ